MGPAGNQEILLALSMLSMIPFTLRFFMRTKLQKARSHERGRPVKEDKDLWVQVSVVIKKTTVAQLRAGAGSKHFGGFLQEHLERCPVPTREEHLRHKLWISAAVRMRAIAKRQARREKAEIKRLQHDRIREAA